MKVVAMFPRTVADAARMAARGRASRLVAILLSFLMLGPVLPSANAQDPLADTLPNLPALGNATPTDHCLAVGDVEPTALQAANQIQQDGVSYFAYDHGVPAICAFNGQPIDQYQLLVATANEIIAQYRQVAQLLQKEADQRAEYTVPQGACSPEDNSTRAPDGVTSAANGQQPDQGTLTDVGTSSGPQEDNGVHCGVTHPQFVILDDRFDGARTGGFGSWQAITAHGETGDGFYLDTQHTFNGTESTYRFGDADGYAQGAHAFLVSPELDLTAVRGNEALAAELANAYQTADQQLASICPSGGGPNVRPVIQPLCPDSLNGGRGGPGVDAPGVDGTRLISNLRIALKSYTAALPLSRQSAYLEFTFKMNMELGLDGVRPWLYIGDHQPTRADLYDRHVFGAPPTYDPGCASEVVNQTVPASTGVNNVECTPTYQSGFKAIRGQDNGYSNGYPNTTETKAFEDPDLSYPSDGANAKNAFSGDVSKPLTVHVDLTPYMGSRVWLVLEAQTMPDTGRGGDKFHDTSNFPRQDGSFGFDLLHVHAQGDAWPRDLRVKDVAATYAPVAAHDPWSDARTTLTTTPNGTPPLVVRLQNAGEYRENATVTLAIQEQLGAAPGSGMHDFATTDPVVVRDIKPSEVRIVSIPWPKAPVNTNLYNVTAQLKLLDAGSLNVTDAANATDPNATAVRPPNAPELPPNGYGGSEVAYALVRAYEDHHLAPVHEPTSTSGPALEVCKAVTATGCVPEYSGAKGEQRIVHGGIRNDGSQPETIQATLVMLLGGLERPDAVVGDSTLTLTDVEPGEVRPVDFDIAPADAGVYTARVIYSPVNATSAAVTATRLVFVERSTGIICYDNVADDRECSPSFARATPDVFQPSNLGDTATILQLSLAGLPALLQQDRAAALALAQTDRDDYAFSMSYQVAEQDPALDAAVSENLTQLVHDVASAGVANVQADVSATSDLLGTAGLRGSHGGLDVTASAQAPDGTLYVTAVDVGTDKYAYQDATGLYARAPGSTAWTKLLDLTNDAVSARLNGEPRADLAWSNVSAMTIGNGTLYLAGDEGTSLAYDPSTGSLSFVPWHADDPGPLTLIAPSEFTANDTSPALMTVNRTGISLVADATGGAGGYVFHWNVTQPAPGPALFLPADKASLDPFGLGSYNASAPNATFTPTAVGDYLLNLTVTDAAGATAQTNVTVHVWPRDSGCAIQPPTAASGALVTQADANQQPGDALAGNASLVRCLRYNWTDTQEGSGSADVLNVGAGASASLKLFLDLAGLDTKESITYKLTFDGQSNDWISFTCSSNGVALTCPTVSTGPGYHVVTQGNVAPAPSAPTVVPKTSTLLLTISRQLLATGAESKEALVDDGTPFPVQLQVSTPSSSYTLAGAGPGAFAFGTDTYAPLGITKKPTATFDPLDGHDVVLSWAATTDLKPPTPIVPVNAPLASTLSYWVQRAEPQASLANVTNWTTIGLTAATTFHDRNVAAYTPYAYRVIPVDSAGNNGTPTATFVGSARLVRPDFNASVWWNDTLWLAANNGIVWRLNQTSGMLEPQQLYSGTTTKTVCATDGSDDLSKCPATKDQTKLTVGVPYYGNVTALATDGDHLYAAGDFDAVFARTPTGGWSLPLKVPPALGGTTIRALALHDGALYASGDAGLVLRLDPATGAFVNVTAPLCAQPVCNYAFAFETPAGDLWLLTPDGAVATCSACDADAVAWTYPEVPLPAFTRNNTPQPSIVLGMSSNASSVVLDTTGGSVLEFGSRSPYANAQDWTTLPALAPHDGGALETLGGTGLSGVGDEYRWGLSNAGASTGGAVSPDLGSKTVAAQPTAAFEDPNATGWVQLRVTFNDTRVLGPYYYNPSPIAQVRVYYDTLPYYTPSSTVTTTTKLNSTCEPEKPGTGTANAALSTCNDTLLMATANFTSNTTQDGWVTESFYVNPPDTSSTTGRYGLTQPSPQVHFDSIAFYDQGTLQWAIDDFRVDAKDAKGVWHPLVSWYGPGSGNGKNRGMPYNACDPARTNQSSLATCTSSASTVAPGTTWSGAPTATSPNPAPVTDVLNEETRSPWHLSNTLTDRPVWVFNNELAGGGTQPRLTNNNDSRLESPVLDLGQAYDPVVSFRTAYAFRTGTVLPDSKAAAGTPTVIHIYDGGWVEVQYEKHGTECAPDATLDATCWSTWTKVYPQHAGTAPEYPTAEDLGYVGNFVRVDNGANSASESNNMPANMSQTTHTGYGDTVGVDPTVLGGTYTNNATSLSFWGRSPTMQPTSTGIVGARDTSTYEPFEIHLGDPKNRVVDDRGEVVNLSGRAIRVGFHALTSGAGSTLDNGDSNSYDGEGWYVTDLKVKGATVQGMDLAATNLSFRVGYDEPRIGVGPGTAVPINVTIENHGQFDVPGYTGTLDVRRVTDASNGRTLPVASIPLAQQPLLPAGASANHTFTWNVPSDEGAQYVLSFTVAPIGIDKDEDPSDNVATLGSLTAPIVAQTHREFHVEFDVSPQNATSEIVRYVPIFVNNTGNVPLSGFVVNRTISLQRGGVPDPAPDARSWPTERPVGAGTRANLQAISDEFDPSSDLFWNASERSDYKFFVSATAPDLPTSTSQVIVRSYATYLFDDAELGPRGEAVKPALCNGQLAPDWCLDADWGVLQPGFLSSRSYGFGDNILVRYPDNADASAVSPILDISGARSARFGFYTKFLFPDSFDGGVVEASVDGGRSWQRLVPEDALDPLNGTKTPGYPGSVEASSALSLTGDPSQSTPAFTGDSSKLPGNQDGWVYREFDLTTLPNVTEANMPYVQYASSALSSYSGLGQKDPQLVHPTAATTPNAYFDSTWNTGPLDQYQYFEHDNLTESSVVSPLGHKTFWWSGSANVVDDGKRPIYNQWLDVSLAPAWYQVARRDDGTIVHDADGYPVPLDANGDPVFAYNASDHVLFDATGAPIVATDGNVPRTPALRIDAKDTVVADWWEWTDGFGVALQNDVRTTQLGAGDLRSYQDEWGSGQGLPLTGRINVTTPTVVERKGGWTHYQSTLSDWAPARTNAPISNIQFMYAPVEFDQPSATTPGMFVDPSNANVAAMDDSRYGIKGAADRGFAIDGLTVTAYKLVGGQHVDERVLMGADDAWNASVVRTCAAVATDYGDGKDSFHGKDLRMPCTSNTPPSNLLQPRTVLPSLRMLEGGATQSLHVTFPASLTTAQLHVGGSYLTAPADVIVDVANAANDAEVVPAPVELVLNPSNDGVWAPAQTIAVPADHQAVITVKTLAGAARLTLGITAGATELLNVTVGPEFGQAAPATPANGWAAWPIDLTTSTLTDPNVDFLATGVRVGDEVNVTQGGAQGFRAPVVAVADAHTLTLGAPDVAPPTHDENGSYRDLTGYLSTSFTDVLGATKHVPLVLNAAAGSGSPSGSLTTTLKFSLSDPLGTPSVDTLDASPKVGDLVRFLSGPACATACSAPVPILAATLSSGTWTLTLPDVGKGTNVAGSTFAIESTPVYQVQPYEGSPGSSWAQVSSLPGIPVEWRTTPVRDAQNHSAEQPLPTGETPMAWYTGGLCLADSSLYPGAKIPQGSAVPAPTNFSVVVGGSVRLQVSWDLLNASNFTVYDSNNLGNHTQGFQANVAPAVGDLVVFTSGPLIGRSTFITSIVDKYNLTIQPLPTGAPVGGSGAATFRVFHYERDCLRQRADSRLVLPAVDLSNVAGEDATLTFWHRYAFDIKSVIAQDPVGSGGVVEISVLDPETGWGDWHQIYADDANKTRPDDAVTNFDVRDHANATIERDGEALGLRGGYDAYTVPYSKGTSGLALTYGLPFDVLPHTRADGSVDLVQFYYGGNSSRVAGNSDQAWVPAHFDLSPYLGKVVRIGFHVAMTGDGLDNDNETTTAIVNPASQALQDPVLANGWWITNISVVGKVIEGAPVQFRFRAATDGSVHDGSWQVDDVGLYGAHYGRNVGLFVDPTPGAFGAFANNTTIVNVTLRNLGDTVRRDLAIEARQTAGGVSLGLASTDDEQWTLDTTNPSQHILRITGFNLAPGQSVVVPILVHVPAGLAQAIDNGTLHLVLKEYSPADQKFVPITDNEVVGFLTRDVQVSAQRDPLVRVVSLSASPAVASVGQPANVTAVVANVGFGPLHLDLTCSATLVGDWSKADRGRGQVGSIASGASTPCALAAGSLDLAPHETTSLVYQATPPSAGALYVVLNGSLEGAGDPVAFAPLNFTVLAGVPMSRYQDSFDPKPLAPGIDPTHATPSQRDGDVQYNWTATKPGAPTSPSPAMYAYPEGHDAPGSLLLGQSDTSFVNGLGYELACSGGPCVATSNPVDLHNFTAERVLLSFWYLPKFARFDGGVVTASTLLNEQDPTSPSSWGSQCILAPVGGYPTTMEEQFPPATQGTTGNGGTTPPAHQWIALGPFPDPTSPTQVTYVWYDQANPTQPPQRTPTNQPPPDRPGGQASAADDENNYAKTFPDHAHPANTAWLWPNSAFGGSSDTWQHAVIDLSQQSCKNDKTGQNETLLGHVIRINFDAFAGAADGPLHRGKGQGWFIDDVSITPIWDLFSPDAQTELLLDNTTKTFHVLVHNNGSYADQVALSLDAGNSSTPDGAVRLPPATTVAPGATAILPVDVTLPRDPSLLPTQYRARLVARSLLDATVSGTSDLVLDFAPREWAELAVRADAPTQVVQEGTEAFVPITVENDGLVDSVPSSLQILDSWVAATSANPDASRCTVAPAGPAQFQVTCASSLDLPSIPSYFQAAEDSTRVLEYQWKPFRGSVGMHTLTITADPLQLGEEYTRTNNVVVLNVPVSDLLVPDLDISAPDALVVKDGTGQPALMEHDADVTHWTVTAGELATLQVTLRNTGKAGATNVDVRAFIGTLSLPKKTIPYLPAGSQTTVTFNWLAQKGEYPLQVIVQTDQVELSTQNDRNPAKGVTLLTVKGYDVKTVLDDLPQDVAAPADVKIGFNVTNAGNAGEDLVLKALLPADAKGWTVTLPRDALFLRAGETYGATATVHIPDGAVAGGHLISIEAVARENPLKVAAASAPLGVHAIYGGSVASTTALASPPTLALPIQLSNEGNSLEPWTLTVPLPSGWTSVESLPTQVVVPPHGETTFVLHVLAPATTPPGARQLDAKAVLPDGTKRDGVLTLDVRPLRTAIVQVADPQPAEVQGALSYPVTVENAGNVQQPFQVLLLDQPAGVDARLEPSNFTLPPGGKTLATLIVKPTSAAAAGSYQLDGYTLFEGVHPDTPEGVSNRQTLTLTLVRPDLRVSGALETAPRSGVRAGDRVSVRVPVTNAGQGSVTDLPVHLFMDDQFVAEARLPVLNAGETRAVTLNWTAVPGQHTLTAVVDPWNDTVDAQRDDNAASAALTVQAAGLSGLAGSSKVPAPGLLSLVVAAAAAVALAQLARRRPPR